MFVYDLFTLAICVVMPVAVIGLLWESYHGRG